MSELEVKECSSCKVTKSIEEFNFSWKKRYRRKMCKECQRAKNTQWFRDHRDTEKGRRDYERRKNKPGFIPAGKLASIRFPEKYKARNTLMNAVKAGKIKRGLCVKCGAQKVEGHHPDYSKPLEAVWLCNKHHMELHRKSDLLSRINE